MATSIFRFVNDTYLATIKNMKNNRINIRVDDEIKFSLDHASEELKIKKTELIRTILVERLRVMGFMKPIRKVQIDE